MAESESFAEHVANGIFMQNLVKRGLFKDTEECIEFVRQNEERIKGLIDQTNHIVKEQKRYPISARKAKESLPTRNLLTSPTWDNDTLPKILLLDPSLTAYSRYQNLVQEMNKRITDLVKQIKGNSVTYDLTTARIDLTNLKDPIPFAKSHSPAFKIIDGKIVTLSAKIDDKSEG